MVKLKSFKGYTLIEVVIVLSIIALLTVTLMLGAGSEIKNERFSGEVKAFANVLREAQVKASTVKTGACASAGNCFWRGTTLDYTANNSTYTLSLLQGNDMGDDQKIGINSKQLDTTYNLSSTGVVLSNISYDSRTEASASIAFLAPDGKAYTSNTSFSSPNFIFSDQAKIIFTLTNPGVTKLTGTVTFDPLTGTISSTVN